MTLGLILLTVGALVCALVAGLVWPRLQLWNWIDSVYYPLAIAGVLLVFFEGIDRRTVLELEDRKRQHQQELSELEGQRPDTDMDLASPKLVKPGGQWLGTIVDTARTCEASAIASPMCFVARDLAPLVSPAQKVLATYTGPEDLFGVCVAANDLFQKLYDSLDLSSFLMHPLATHYFDGLKRGFRPIEFELVYAYIDGVRPQLENRTQEILDAIALDEEGIALMRPRYETEIAYGILIMKAFEACMRAPEEFRNGQYAEWVERHRDKLTKGEELDEALLQQRKTAAELNAAGEFRFTFWPFFLVVALSLKFGKGLAQIRKGGLHIRNVLKNEDNT